MVDFNASAPPAETPVEETEAGDFEASIPPGDNEGGATVVRTVPLLVRTNP